MEKKQWVTHLVKILHPLIIFTKNLLVLSAASDGISTVSFATVIWAPVCITSASLSLVFSILVMELQKTFKNNEKEKE